MKKFDSKIGYNLIWKKYSEIALDCYNVAQTSYKEMMTQDESIQTPDGDTYRLRDNVVKNCIETVCFSVMALEGYINTFSSAYISPEYAESIDRFEIPEKWKAALSEHTGKEVGRGEKPIQRIKKAVKARNGFTHPKSTVITTGEEMPLFFEQDLKHEFMGIAYESLMAVHEASEWIRANCGESYLLPCETDFSQKFDNKYKEIFVTWKLTEEFTLF